MRLAVWQAAGARGGADIERGNLARLDAAAAAAAQAGADVLLSPEMFATGYALDAAAGGPHLAEAVAATAVRHRVAQVWSEPAGGFVTAVVTGADGAELGRYRKVHLWGPGERAAFAPGDGPPLVVDLAGLRVGVAVCYDVEFPETARAAALAGAQLLAVPTAIEEPSVARVLLPARAMENGIVVAYANHAASAAVRAAGGPAFCGGSVVAGPDGAVLAAAGEGEQLLVVDVDVASIAAARAATPYLVEMRPAVYAGWREAGATTGATTGATGEGSGS